EAARNRSVQSLRGTEHPGPVETCFLHLLLVQFRDLHFEEDLLLEPPVDDGYVIVRVTTTFLPHDQGRVSRRLAVHDDRALGSDGSIGHLRVGDRNGADFVGHLEDHRLPGSHDEKLGASGAHRARGEDHRREAQDGGRHRRGTRPGRPDRVKDRGTHRSTPYVMDEKECHRESFGAACSVTLASRIIRTIGFGPCDEARAAGALATTVAFEDCAARFGLEVATRVLVPDSISLVLRPATRSVSPSSGLRRTRCSLPSWRPNATCSAPCGSTRMVTACTVIGLLSCCAVF